MPATMLASEFAHSHGTIVEEVMSKHVVSAKPDTPLAEIAALLERIVSNACRSSNRARLWA